MVIPSLSTTAFSGLSLASLDAWGGTWKDAMQAALPMEPHPLGNNGVLGDFLQNKMSVFGKGPLLQIAYEPETGVRLSTPAAVALVAGAVLLTFLVWWVTDRVGHRDVMRLHEFHGHSLEFQKAADEAILFLGTDQPRIKPLIDQMKQHLALMRMLRRPLQSIHRFRLDVSGDDPRILDELDQKIQDSQDVLEAISEAFDRQLKSLPVDQDGKVVRLADRRKNPKNGR